MQKIRTIIKTPYEISDPEALWIDTSNADSPTLKVHEQGTWKSLGNEGSSDTYELKSNKVTALSASSTDEQYPSAKAVYDAIADGGGASITIIEPTTNWFLIKTEPERFEQEYDTIEELSSVAGISVDVLRRLFAGEIYPFFLKAEGMDEYGLQEAKFLPGAYSMEFADYWDEQRQESVTYPVYYIRFHYKDYSGMFGYGGYISYAEVDDPSAVGEYFHPYRIAGFQQVGG